MHMLFIFAIHYSGADSTSIKSSKNYQKSEEEQVGIEWFWIS